jgi:hypothetical protein
MFFKRNTQINGEIINPHTHKTIKITREGEKNMAFTIIWRSIGWIQRL